MNVTSRLLVTIRQAGRSLRKTPLFTAVTVVSMGFGIGANTTVFTLVDQVLLRSISVSHPSELVQVGSVGSPMGGMGDGTELTERDDQPLPKGWSYRVAVVNETLA